MNTTEIENVDRDRGQMLRINEQQRVFYETKALSEARALRETREPDRQASPGFSPGLATRLWRRARRRIQVFRERTEITEQVQGLQLQWMGDLTGKRVLDLGCYDGPTINVDLAARCAFYLGMDLSTSAIERLRQKLLERGLTHAEAVTLDFLAPDFPYDAFDVVYAHGVMHHFEHFETFLAILHQRLAPGGRVISFDPLETAWSIWLARKLYRPFQTDAAWEWPFTQRTFAAIEKYFRIEAIQGVLGCAKWAIPLSLVPFAQGWAVDVAKRLNRLDLQWAHRPGPGLWRCMQVAMHLVRRDV